MRSKVYKDPLTKNKVTVLMSVLLFYEYHNKYSNDVNKTTEH